MPDVTLDADDLQALLFAAGCANASPAAKKILKSDPQFEEVEPRLTEAIDRAGRAWRKAGRKEEWPERFEITAQDLQLLRSFFNLGAHGRRGVAEAYFGQAPRSLLTKGMIELGVWRETIAWSNSGEEATQHVERRFRLTQDALEFLEADTAAAADRPIQQSTADQTVQG